MDRFIVPKIADTIEARKRKYDEFILKAEEINNKALASLARYEEAMAAAKQNADLQIKQSEAELKKFIAARETEIDNELRDKIEKSEETLALEKADTLKKIEEISEAAVLSVIEKLGLKKDLTLADVKKIASGEDDVK